MTYNDIAELQQRLKVLHEYKNDAEKEMNFLLEGKDVIIQTGKYKGRRARILKYYYHDDGSEILNVQIYRIDGRVGFKGQEKFIHDHDNEWPRFKDCEFA